MNLDTLEVQVTVAKRMMRAEFCELFYSWPTVFLNLLELLRMINFKSYMFILFNIFNYFLIYSINYSLTIYLFFIHFSIIFIYVLCNQIYLFNYLFTLIKLIKFLSRRFYLFLYLIIMLLNIHLNLNLT